MLRWFTALLFAAFIAAPVLADDKKNAEKAAPTGIWAKEHNGANIRMNFAKKDELTMTVEAGDASLTIVMNLKEDKDGAIKATTAKVTKTGDFPVDVKKDFECSFKFKIDGKTAKLSDLKANDNEDQTKDALEGTYEKAEDK